MTRGLLRLALLLAPASLLLGACGGGGGPPAPPPIEVNLDFAVVRDDVTTSRSFCIANPLTEQATVDLLEPVTGAIQPKAGSLPGTASPGDAFVLPLELVPAGAGPVVADVRLSFVGTASGARREVDVRVRGTVDTRLLRMMTPAIDFGAVRIGASATRSLTIRNDSGATPILVTGLSALPAEFQVAGPSLPVPVTAGASISFPIQFVPAGRATHSFGVQVDYEGGNPLQAAVHAVSDTWVERIVVDFGSVPVVGGQTDWLDVDVPQDAVSLSLEGIGPAGTVVGTNGWEGPGGVVYENDTFTGAYLQFPDSEVFTATLPQSDDPNVQIVPGGGTYRFRLHLLSGSATTLDARAIILSRPLGMVTNGRLDLNVFFSPGVGVSKATAAADPRLQEILAEADRIYSQQALRLGAIDYYDLGSSSYDSVSSEAEFGDMLAESNVAAQTRLNLFFVKSTLGGGTVGVAARVGGPYRNGTRASGVMVDYDFASSATVGYVVAHECGHFLGLLHTTESDGSHDILADTAECSVGGLDCPSPGTGYLMHWQVLSVDPVLSDVQGRVVQSHPCVGEPAAGLSGLAWLPGPPQGPPAGYDPLPGGWCATCSRAAGR